MAATAASALVLGLVAAIGATTSAPAVAAAAPLDTLQMSVVSSATVGVPAIVTEGDPVTDYQFLLQKIEAGNPDDSAHDCLPTKAPGSHDPAYPANCDWPGTRSSNTGDPIITSGTQDDINQGKVVIVDGAHPEKSLPEGDYIVSVKADGYEIGGAHFTVPLTAPVQVKLNPYPLPLATIRVRVFQDTVPADGVYEIDAERGLSGFRAYLNDLLGDVSTDYFGNPLCTTYVHSAKDALHPDGQVVFVDGKPVISPTSTGQCVSDNNGDIVIPNMAPGRYGIVVRQPATRANWMQTTTLEGAQDHDWWVMAGDTGYGQETTWGGELVPEVQFGFVPPQSVVSPRQARGTGSISGTVHEGCTYIASTGGAYVPNSVPGANGTKDCGPIKNPLVAVSGLDVGDQVVWAGIGNADGTYSVPGLADGNYMVTVWDAPINHILETFNVSVVGGAAVQAGTTYIGGWFTHITGSVFIDTNGNGRRDAGEQGVQRTTLAYRERDNTPMDQFTNAIDTDVNGNYDILQAYPLSRFMILEHANPRYKPTGITVQACNEKKATTYLDGAVDISVLPVLGLCGRVDWGVEPYATGETGGIVGTITYGTTRNELDPANSATESWQPGIPNVTVHLYAPVLCGSPEAAKAAYDADRHNCGADGDTMTNDSGALVHGPELADPYLSETYKRPTGCVARDRTGAVLTGEQILPTSADAECVEAPLAGWQAVVSDKTVGATAQDVNGNYGFGTSKLNLYAPGDPRNPAPAHNLPLYADLAAAGYPEQTLLAGDYIVSVDIPQDHYGKPMYKVTREEDINIFGGDDMAPQENFPPTPDTGAGDPPAPEPGQPIEVGLGVQADCAGPLHTVNVTDPDFLAGGGSPYEGQSRPLCTDKLVEVVDATQQVTNFELFTDVPLASHFWGLILNDLGVSSDPATIQYGEVEGLKHVPTGIYDWRGNLVDTAVSDPNGFYEAVVPSTMRINNPSPSGVSPNMYRLVGNDPGTPGHLNKDYDPRYRTIATNFQAWPGLWTVTDTAPTLTAAQTFNGQMTAVKCDVPTAEPQVFAVDEPVTAGLTSVTIQGRDFGTQGARSSVLLGAPGDAAVDPSTAAPLPVTSWSDTSITVAVPAAGNGFAPGARQLLVRSALGAVSTTGITLHVTGGSYTPTVITVGPGKDVDTDNGGTLQQALDTAASGSQATTKLVVAYPLTPTADNPRGDYLENVVVHSGVKLQGIGTGGFRKDGSHVGGSVINGERFQEGTPQGNAWLTLVSGLDYKNKDIPLPDSATVTVVTPGNGNGLGSATIKPSIDGFMITGGIQQTTPTNINILTGGSQTPYGGTGAVVTQGGGIYVHGGSDGLTVTNNRIEGNSGSYAGAIRVGTPYANGNIGVTADSLGLTDTGATPSTNYRLVNRGLVVAHNTVANNGGANLAGGIGLFSGTVGYRVAYNDVCGNFSAEYGGGISHYGFSRGARIDHNRVWFNESYDEGGGILVAGEVPPDPDSVSGGAGDVRLDSNRVAQNLSNDDGGGIRLLNAGTRRITIENSEIVNNVSAHEGGGIALNDATDVVIDNDTIAGNITTATAVTSNGQPAAAGLATANLSSQLQALVANVDPSQPDFTDPVTFNDVFWDNRAGAFLNGLAILGIGDGDANVWDIGSPDSSGLVDVHASVLGSVEGTTGLGLDNTQADPAFVLPHTVSVHADARRSFVAFRQTVITDMTVNPWNADVSDYGLKAGSPAIDHGVSSIVLQGSTRTAPTTDLTGRQRTGAPDAGALERATVTPAVPAALAAPTVTGADNHQISFSWTAATATNPAVTSYSLRVWTAASGGAYAGGCLLTGTSCTVTGLTNGTHYFADVVATNAVGSSAPSLRTEAVPAPPAPVATLEPQNHGLVVRWTIAPSVSQVQKFTAVVHDAATGGADVTSCATIRSGSTAPALSCIVTGLTNGQSYWVDVTADYGNGDTATGSRVAGVPNPAKPGAPTALVAAAAPVSGGLDVGWRPGTTGGVPVHYAVTAVALTAGNPPAGNPCSVDSAATTGTLGCRITGLAVGTTYRVTVTPSNVAGTGASASANGTTATVPGAPRPILGFGTNGNANVTFRAPASDGGLPVTSYTARVYASSASATPLAGTSCTVAGPSILGTYTTSCSTAGNGSRNIRITATNAIGTGPASSTNVSVLGLFAFARVATPMAGTPGTLLAMWAGRATTTGTTTWIVKAYATKTSTRPLAWCIARSSARSCALKGLVHGRTYYVSVWRASTKAPTVRVANRIVGRAR